MNPIALTYTPESSQLLAFGYDAESKTLEIHFTSTNTVYHYFDVPQSIYDGLKAAESKGSFFIRNVKRAPFQYKKLEGVRAVSLTPPAVK